MPGVPETLDGAALARWGRLCVAGLGRHRDEINALNVFPVADADTGTNLLATMRAAVAAAEPLAAGSPARAVAGAMARAGTAGARGNSGIILSQVLRGLAEAVQDGPLTAATVRIMLRRAAILVREALSTPVDGTMLTVLEAAADRAADCPPDAPLPDVALAAADGAVKALGDTPSQLTVLREAGVVDAGARGLLVLLDALVEVTGVPVPIRPAYPAATDHTGRITAAHTDIRPTAPDAAARVTAAQYEVMYLLSETDAERIAALRNELAGLGDSVAVVGDGAGGWSAHVHCGDAGVAVEAGLAAGRLSRIRIEGLAVDPQVASGPADRGILAVASGTGAARLFEDAGAVVLDGEVTADRLLTAIRELPHREVLVLPNGALPAHELVAVSVAARGGVGGTRSAARDVLMLPSGSMVQGLAALAVHDAGRIAVDDAFAMSEAAAGTRWGALRIAAERALTIVGTCARGDGLGLVGHDVVVIDPDARAAARTLLDRMLGLGGELVTLLLGAAAPAGLGDELAQHITATFPGVEVVAYDGGQPVDLVQIGVE
ncbi:DAK2 domain-containing protein [Nocardia terpenica]|uniref:Dihydroxyacetone kinase n=1 Tax=Nocardia terpenica TaxID=455432 RepID=A0A291RXC3_9NOCA|nr:DAK2 domain-containing protein [Nocardia terpenica]ATL72163.1 dihydroxyacetone kinase [Nocardia terpenica]